MNLTPYRIAAAFFFQILRSLNSPYKASLLSQLLTLCPFYYRNITLILILPKFAAVTLQYNFSRYLSLGVPNRHNDFITTSLHEYITSIIHYLP